jgi:hypothetical protein
MGSRAEPHVTNLTPTALLCSERSEQRYNGFFNGCAATETDNKRREPFAANQEEPMLLNKQLIHTIHQRLGLVSAAVVAAVASIGFASADTSTYFESEKEFTPEVEL